MGRSQSYLEGVRVSQKDTRVTLDLHRRYVRVLQVD